MPLSFVFLLIMYYISIFEHKYFIFHQKTTAYEIRYQNIAGTGIDGIQ